MSTRKSKENEDFPDSPAARLMNALGTLDLPQRRVAEMVGLSENYLSQVKTGNQPLTKQVAQSFQRVFGFSAKWLLRGEGADRIAEGTATYELGRSPVVIAPRSGVAFAHVTYHCGCCHSMVAFHALRCLTCGANVAWPESLPGPQPAPNQTS